LISYYAARQRAEEQAARARIRAQAQAIRAHQQFVRQQQHARFADAKEQLRLFHEAQEEEVSSRNRELAESIGQITSVLQNALTSSHRLNFEKLKSHPEFEAFDPGALGKAEDPPRATDYLPPPPGFFAGLIPGAKARHQLAVRAARARFDAEAVAHAKREGSRQVALETERARYQAEVKDQVEKAQHQHDQIDALKKGYEAGDKDAIRQYCEAVLSSETYPDGWPDVFKLAYVPESKQLVVEYDFPGFEIIPVTAAYKYVKAKKEMVSTQCPDTERRRMYSEMIAQATLRGIHALFDADYAGHAETIVFNGHVEAIDQATGHSVHPCLVTLRTTREVFQQIDLSRVDPEICLKGLNAAVSKKPTELAPVRPVLEFNMVDPRFVEEQDIISGLDNRTNLMDLNPREFESLITNLFEKMGLETRQTRPSRDGGVDCVAYDPRPIFGGKVVIQAKRYKNTVGVSAVRDLFGTVQNEGASKGILVTTSGFGRASFEFADHKPLELLDGGNLLYLLKEHAGIEAKIEVPDDWKDPSQVLSE
jgi:restriction system protein